MNVVLSFIALACLCAPGHALGRAPQAPPEASSAKSSLELVGEALDRGDIDEDTATLYRVFAIVGDDRLPMAYRGGKPIRDGTPVMRDARSRYEGLRPDVREAIKPYLFPGSSR